ncbi:acyltransferase family protein [Streptomyces zagrosensis]|uniref:Peptidoglycan/LPS O-acetylase OafA/YrhL n=1 Tax=Streptomyces zagrosensis TaxID=1042984 RepID=A0A7W9QBZ8_9ACTN|nr:acyltransferase [Streptomyces zagrosensis]MBB5937369.1 peptidoglycan/LPS O-acetylase OafA/YrhL [Streptomyces zagrosensis]
MRYADRGDVTGGETHHHRSAPRLYVLDGLRLLAALMVVLFHYVALYGGWDSNPSALFPSLHPFARYGWLGVEIFFLISGFVICMSTWGRSLGDFVVSRVSRIYPAYWAAVLLTAGVVSLWPQVRTVAGWGEVLTNLTMFQQGLGVSDVDGVYWTLFIELKFYALFAVVVATGVTYRKCVMFCGIWTAAGVIAPTADNTLLDMWAMPMYSPYFIAGIAFYLMHRFRPTALLWGIVLVSLLLAQHHLGERITDNLADPKQPIAHWPAHLVVGLAFAVMALIALGMFDRVRWRWLAPAGALTYPLYLVHMYVGLTMIHWLRGLLPAPYLVLAVLVVMLLAAWVLHRCVERPLGSWLRRALRQGLDDMRRYSAPLASGPQRSQATTTGAGQAAGTGPAADAAELEHAQELEHAATARGAAPVAEAEHLLDAERTTVHERV